jgi:hypothetical protein
MNCQCNRLAANAGYDCAMEWENLLAGLASKGYTFKTGPEGDTIAQITSITGKVLENPTKAELGQLLSGMTIDSVLRERAVTDHQQGESKSRPAN